MNSTLAAFAHQLHKLAESRHDIVLHPIGLDLTVEAVEKAAHAFDFFFSSARNGMVDIDPVASATK